MDTFNRRQFLKLAGLTIASGVALFKTQPFTQAVQLSANLQIRFGESLIRGTSLGDILSSSDEGKTWNKLVSFGERHSVLQLAQQGDEIFVNLGPDSHDFWLRSTDGKKWFTI